MRVAMVSSSVSRRAAGVGIAVEGLSGHLHRRGVDVRVFALDDPDWAHDAANWRGAPVRALGVKGPRALGYAPRMTAELQEYAPDIVHLHGLWMYPSRAVTLWARRTGRPYLISPHGMLAPAALAFSRPKKRLARVLYQDSCFARAAAYHATSHEEAEQIRAFGLTQAVELFPNGIDLRPAPELPRRTSVLSLGRLHPVKGLDLLIRAWARIAPAHPRATLEIVGPDDSGHRRDLEALANDLCAPRITFHGPVYGEDKFRLLASASVFVLPSRSENFGLTVVEALMMGTPVVASNGTPWSGLERKGCGLWVAPEAPAFAEALERLLSLPEAARLEMGSAGRRWVEEEFTWPRVSEVASAAYERVLAE